MLSKEVQRTYREELFRYLDGLGCGPPTYALHKHGVIAHLLENQSASISDLAKTFKANEGYLNVALRLMASQGWLVQEIDNTTDTVVYSTTEKQPSWNAIVICIRLPLIYWCFRENSTRVFLKRNPLKCG